MSEFPACTIVDVTISDPLDVDVLGAVYSVNVNVNVM